MGLFSGVVGVFKGSKDKKFAKKNYQLSEAEAKANRSLSIRQKKTEKYYNDLSAKNLLKRNIGKAKTSFGAYGIKSTSGSALAFQNNINQEHNDEQDKRNKFFKLNMDTINHNYKFNTQKNLLNYQKNKSNANFKIIEGLGNALL